MCVLRHWVDAPSTGNKFTWTNGTYWSKIDRVLLNAEWHNEDLHCLAEFLDFNTISDHTPVMVKFMLDSPSVVKHFRFLNMWLQYPSFKDVLRNNWSDSFTGTKQITLCKKLKALKYPLKELNKKEFSRISERVVEAQIEYLSLINSVAIDPLHDMLKNQVKISRAKVNSLLEAERRFFQEKIRNRHLLQANKCSKYFHSLIRMKSASTFVVALKKLDGSITFNQEGVIIEFQCYFKSLIGSNLATSPIQANFFEAGNNLSTLDCTIVTEPINDILIKEALFNIGEEKTLGLDGYTTAFYKANWEFIKEDFLAAVMNSSGVVACLNR